MRHAERVTLTGVGEHRLKDLVSHSCFNTDGFWIQVITGGGSILLGNRSNQAFEIADTDRIVKIEKQFDASTVYLRGAVGGEVVAVGFF